MGYAETTETTPGVWRDVITEYTYFGNVIRNSRQLQEAQKVNDNVTVSNTISIVADPYARANFHKIRYVGWNDTLWKVVNIEERSPRLELRLGEVYNGPTPD